MPGPRPPAANGCRASFPPALSQGPSRLERAALLASVGFAALAWAVRRGRPLHADLLVTRHVQATHLPGLRPAMHAVSALGFAPWNWLTPVTAAAALWAAGLRLEAIFTTGTWLAGGIAAAMKIAVERPRPRPPAAVVARALRDSSFPSGHTVHYVTFYGYLFYIASTLPRRSLAGHALQVLTGSLVGLVGLSRIYRGEHWLSDVLAAYCFGILYLMAWVGLYRWARSAARRAKPAMPGPAATSGAAW